MSAHHYDHFQQAQDEANYFARCLLMPEAFVLQWIAANPGDFNNDKYTAAFAKAFQVPIAVAIMRLGELEQ